MGNKNPEGNAAHVLKNNKLSKPRGPGNTAKKESHTKVLAFFQALCCGCFLAASG
jgi:hypothetical protein